MSNPFALLDEDGAAPAAKAPAPKVEAAKPAAGKEGACFEGPSLCFVCTWQLTVSDSQPPAVCACLTCALVTVSPLQPPSRLRAATQARRRLRPAAGVAVAAEARHAPWRHASSRARSSARRAAPAAAAVARAAAARAAAGGAAASTVMAKVATGRRAAGSSIATRQTDAGASTSQFLPGAALSGTLRALCALQGPQLCTTLVSGEKQSGSTAAHASTLRPYHPPDTPTPCSHPTATRKTRRTALDAGTGARRPRQPSASPVLCSSRSAFCI